MSGLGYLLLILFFPDIFNGNVIVPGDELHGFHEGEVLLLHDESDGIPTTVATETME